MGNSHPQIYMPESKLLISLKAAFFIHFHLQLWISKSLHLFLGVQAKTIRLQLLFSHITASNLSISFVTNLFQVIILSCLEYCNSSSSSLLLLLSISPPPHPSLKSIFLLSSQSKLCHSSYQHSIKLPISLRLKAKTLK